MTTSAGPRKIHYAWIAAGVTFVTLLAAAGARATPGVIVLPIAKTKREAVARAAA